MWTGMFLGWWSEVGIKWQKVNIHLKEVKAEEEYIKKCITDALTYNNDLANEMFLELHPDETPYAIDFVFEEKKWWKNKNFNKYIKQCIIDALTYSNELANERFWEFNPTSKPYSILFVLVGLDCLDLGWEKLIYMYWILIKNMLNLDEKRQTCRNVRTQS